jgi:nucleotide-binding universal stress UspA family protein
MKKIKNILVPTDFSVTARNAFNYATLLAESVGAKLQVVHIHEHFIPVTTVAVAPLAEYTEEHLEEAMTHFLSDESGATRPLVRPKVEAKILRGDVVTELVNLSQDRDVDLIVMGTTGLQDFMSKIIGSTSLEVANQAHCPVLLVPRDAAWSRLDRILFAANTDATTPETVRAIAQFAEQIGTPIHFVHIKTAQESDDLITDTVWNTLFEAAEPRLPFEIHNLRRGDVVEGLKAYVAENAIDLLAFVSRHRGFWRNLMHHSITADVAISVEKPMLVLHFDDV